MQVGHKTAAFGVCILHGLVAALQDLHIALSGELHVTPFVSLLCSALPCPTLSHTLSCFPILDV